MNHRAGFRSLDGGPQGRRKKDMKTFFQLGRFNITTALLAFLIAMCANGAFAKSGSGPVISVTVSPNQITNEGEEAVFTFTLSAPAPRRILLNYLISGFPIEVPDSDFVLVGNFNKFGQLVIPAGQTTATIILHTFVEDVEAPSSEHFVLQIVNGGRYRVGSASSAELHIDNLK